MQVWIHGGGFVSGSTKRYDGSNLARLHNVIFVAIPYRVGILGFIANEALLEVCYADHCPVSPLLGRAFGCFFGRCST